MMMENLKSDKENGEKSQDQTVATTIKTEAELEFQNILITGECEHDQPCCSWKITGRNPDQTVQKKPNIMQAEDSSSSMSITMDISCSTLKERLPTVNDNIVHFNELASRRAAAQHALDKSHSGSLNNLFDDLECLEPATAALSTLRAKNQPNLPSQLDTNPQTSQSPVVTNKPQSQCPVVTNQPQSQCPVVTNQPKSQSPEITNNSKSNSLEIKNQQQGQSLVVTNKPQSNHPVVTNQPEPQSPGVSKQIEPQTPLVKNQPQSKSHAVKKKPQSQSTAVRHQVQSNPPVNTNLPQTHSPVVTNQQCDPPPTAIIQPRVHGTSEPPSSNRGPHIINIPNDSINSSLQRTDLLVNRQPNSTNPALGPPPSYSKSLLDRRINPCASIQFVAPIPPPSYDGVESELRYGPTLGHTGRFTLGLGNTWQSQPQPAYCPICETVVITQIDVRVSRTAHVVAMVMFLLLCWPFCLLPYFLNVCNYTFHFCSVCQSYLGARRPFQRG